MVDRLAFVKTVEAILAAVIAMSVYNFIQDYNTNQVQTISRSPETMINDFLNVIELDDIIKNYDYLGLDSLFFNLFYETIYYYFEPVYHEKITVTASDYEAWPNISFIYHFPQGIDKNSVRVVSGNYELGTNATFNWYGIPLNFNQSVNDEYIEINATIDGTNINNNSLKFFIRGKESLLSITDWNESPANTSPVYANATVIVYVPEINTSESSYIYFARGGFTNITYPSLTATKEINTTKFNIEETRTAEVIFSPDNISSSTDTYYLKYTLFSNENNGYNNFMTINNTGVSISLLEDRLKEGTVPYTTISRGEDSIKKIIPINGGFVELRVYGGYS